MRCSMRNQKHPFEIANSMISYVSEIAGLLGKLSAVSFISANPKLRRNNRIRTIHGSLAIEQNTLSIEQMTAVLNDKQVLAPPKDIVEVKNTYEIYERLDELNTYSVDDLLTAHGWHVPHSICRYSRQRWACPAFWHASTACP